MRIRSAPGAVGHQQRDAQARRQRLLVDRADDRHRGVELLLLDEGDGLVADRGATGRGRQRGGAAGMGGSAAGGGIMAGGGGAMGSPGRLGGSHTFARDGFYDVGCDIHPGMSGAQLHARVTASGRVSHQPLDHWRGIRLSWNAEGDTALIAACLEGKEAVVLRLIDAGAAVSTGNPLAAFILPTP